MKKQVIFFVTIFAVVSARAQTGFPRNGFNDNEFGIGASASVIRGYTNLAKQNNEFAFGLNFIYNYQPFLPVSVELQAGRLSGGGLLKSEDRDGRKYVNNFKVLIFHVDYQLGQGMDEMEIETDNSWFLQRVRECYAGTGLGVVFNKNTVQRYSIYTPPYPMPGYYKFPGTDRSVNVSLPFRFGYEYKICDDYNYDINIPRMAIDVEYVHNFVFGSGLDGYNDPQTIFKHQHTCQYRQVVVAFKYFFGGRNVF